MLALLFLSLLAGLFGVVFNVSAIAAAARKLSTQKGQSSSNRRRFARAH